jgi:uncharacterized protein with ParB-like and HNH nuclease domain
MKAGISTLDNELTQQSNMLRTERLDVSFGEILNMYEHGEIIIDPAFQRLFRWDDDQKTRFIESLLLGIPIPPIFVAANSEGVWELVDGLQRISTFLSFVGVLRLGKQLDKKNKWTLLPGTRVSSLEGYTYESLPQKYRFALKRAVCRVEILKWDSNYDMRYELFNRLNTGGTPLTQQEIRNCIFRDISSTFNDFLHDLAGEKDFKRAVMLSHEQNECLFNEELVLRFFALLDSHEGSKIKTGFAQYMTDYMKGALQDEHYDYVGHKKLFLRVFKVLVKLGYKTFRQTNGMFATSLYDVITYGVAVNINKYELMDTASILRLINENVRKNENFLRFSRRGGNNQKERIVNRIKVANELF